VSQIEDNNKVYLEIVMQTDTGQKKSYRIKLENKQISNSLENKIRFAKADFDETFFMLHNYNDDDD
jgi:hypothetical protein